MAAKKITRFADLPQPILPKKGMLLAALKCAPEGTLLFAPVAEVEAAADLLGLLDPECKSGAFAGRTYSIIRVGDKVARDADTGEHGILIYIGDADLKERE